MQGFELFMFGNEENPVVCVKHFEINDILLILE